MGKIIELNKKEITSIAGGNTGGNVVEIIFLAAAVYATYKIYEALRTYRETLIGCAVLCNGNLRCTSMCVNDKNNGKDFTPPKPNTL